MANGGDKLLTEQQENDLFQTLVQRVKYLEGVVSDYAILKSNYAQVLDNHQKLRAEHRLLTKKFDVLDTEFGKVRAKCEEAFEDVVKEVLQQLPGRGCQ